MGYDFTKNYSTLVQLLKKDKQYVVEIGTVGMLIDKFKLSVPWKICVKCEE